MRDRKTWEKLRLRAAETARKLARFLLNPRLLLCFGIAWMLTNGWSYLFAYFGLRLGIPWMAAAGTAYMGFLWLPFTPEKIVTFTIAIFLLRLLFPRDQVTLEALRQGLHKLRTAMGGKKKRTE